MAVVALSKIDVSQIVARDHPDPHHVLGAHSARTGVRFSVFRPDAEAVFVHAGAAERPPLRLRRVDAAGFFSGVAKGAVLPLTYEVEIHYPDGVRLRLRDPYAFLPTLGELDLHLIAEGRHEELYERLGAHPRELDAVAGTSFAVWAPSARSVSVVGDFNDWDGRLHQMRSLGGAGVWELFVPGVARGAHYKYEIRTRDGLLGQPASMAALARTAPA